MIKILIDTTPLATGHAIRGIGLYTRFLTEELEKLSAVVVKRSSLNSDQQFTPDILHYPYFDLFFPTLPLVRRVKTVVTIHDTIPLKFPDQYKPGKRGALSFIKQKAALKTVDAIITDSISSKADIVEYLKISTKKIQVVPLAANPMLQAANEKLVNKVRRQFNLPNHYILYVGDINYNKNIPQLIKAMRYLPKKVKLVCLGKNFYPHDIPEWQWIESQLALSDVEGRVKFITNVLGDDYQSLAGAYTGALAYIQPSLYEGFGLPVLEAMQCKTPVVSTKNSSLVEVGGQHAVFVKEDAEDIARGISQVLDWSKTKRETSIRNAFKWSQSFSWQRTAELTLRVYQQVKG